ncbi:hypothetical protein HDV00_001507 [Rhizophlyctis rosea]|nr:hypothetical protein HDV00_001507 [Rhizophlyctis rosea]
MERVGCGVYGKVYRAVRKSDGVVVAVKKTRMEEDGVSATTLREVGVLRMLGGGGGEGEGAGAGGEGKWRGRENIVRLHEVFASRAMDMHRSSAIFMVMDYAEIDLERFISRFGRSGGGVLTERGGLEVEVIKHLMYQLLNGLGYCHGRRVCHRDLKPSNILISAGNILKIADFGLSRNISFPTKPYSPDTVTLLYRAPEIFYGSKEYSTPVDMWSAGCIFAEMYRGRPLFMGDSGELTVIKDIQRKLGDPRSEDITYPFTNKIMQVCDEPEKPFRELVNSMDDDAFDLLQKLVHYNPYKRIRAREAMKHPYFHHSNR